MPREQSRQCHVDSRSLSVGGLMTRDMRNMRGSGVRGQSSGTHGSVRCVRCLNKASSSINTSYSKVNHFVISWGN